MGLFSFLGNMATGGLGGAIGSMMERKKKLAEVQGQGPTVPGSDTGLGSLGPSDKPDLTKMLSGGRPQPVIQSDPYQSKAQEFMQGNQPGAYPSLFDRIGKMRGR